MISRRIQVTAFGLLLTTLNLATAQCPSALPAYQDLEQWVHGNIQNGFSHNYIEVHVVVINPVGLTQWTKGVFMHGVAGYGQCSLATNPTVPVLFSDRTYKAPGTDRFGNPVGDLNQPFSIRDWDKHVVSLDMVQNTISNQSLSWNAKQTLSDVKRIGNVIYGTDNSGGMIILTVLKRSFTGNTIPAVEP